MRKGDRGKKELGSYHLGGGKEVYAGGAKEKKGTLPETI